MGTHNWTRLLFVYGKLDPTRRKQTNRQKDEQGAANRPVTGFMLTKVRKEPPLAYGIGVYAHARDDF